jgi:G:T-mismatch repair DNA endonuclease (very short patch repair protein)
MPNTRTLEFYFKKYNVSEEIIRTCYIDKFYSLPDFRKEFGMSYGVTKKILSLLHIDRRTHIVAANSIKTKTQREQTLMGKYGVVNASQSAIIKDRKRTTFLKNYGVDNIWKSAAYKLWLDNYMLVKYGKKRITNPDNLGWGKISSEEKTQRIEKLQNGLKRWLDTLSDDEKSAISAHALSFVKNSSKLESRISDILTNLNISHTRQFRIRRKVFDFKICNTNILIEVNGDFWHANPLLYPDPHHIINFPFGNTEAQEVWDKDGAKKQLAIDSGYKVIYIWEYDIKNISDEELETLIFKILNDNGTISINN